MHRSGFVNIIGRPNVGKSTLMNALVGERMSIITHKPQTTRHRIIGLVSSEDYQIVFSDTPGFVRDPNYKMHESMNRFVRGTFEDADLMLLVVDVNEEYENDHPLIRDLGRLEVPLFLIINKIDTVAPEKITACEEWWRERATIAQVHPISALKQEGTEALVAAIVATLPEGPEYYPKDQFTDRPERFFMSEIIREKILLLYHDEIPYSCEVVIEYFKEDPKKPLTRIGATIYCMRDTQKSILIGKNGAAIKQLGIEARKSMEVFLERQVFLELHIKVRDNWRDDERLLKHFGYEE
jgi:GTP-binding protein Era